MEDCPSGTPAHSWRAASARRKAWALSRGSWQASESRDGSSEGQTSPRRMEEKAALSEEPGRIPNKITSWLKECRSPLGASLDEQSSTVPKGVVKNGCSFEDDLSLGAEANHLQSSSADKEQSCCGMLAKDKRSQFHQRGLSMNSTGSGKSSTVSSVSELLDLYVEDPEEILYNLGFGTEEPHIASKIPPRFFSSSSSAKGIDIKVYLQAQLQRMELESPNYALTSRFRQMEVLATVTNAFSSLYSQVSGLPVQRIGSCDTESATVTPLKTNNSVLNAAKMLKKTITKLNLHSPGAENQSPAPAGSDSDKGGSSSPLVEDSELEKQQRGGSRKKDSPSLATVAEESHAGLPDPSVSGDPAPPGEPVAAESSPEPGTEPDPALDRDMSVSSEADLERTEERECAVTSTPDKEPSAQLANPRIAHLLTQTRDSFEMEEVQSNEGEAPGGVCDPARAEQLLRTASQHSDSSGFAEDPSTDGSANYLKVQESSDSCDSETTVTSTAGDVSTPLVLDHPAFGRLQGDEAALMPTVLTNTEAHRDGQREPEGMAQVPEGTPHQNPKAGAAEMESELVSTTEPSSTAESSSPNEPDSTAESSSPTEPASTAESSSPTEPTSTAESSSPNEPDSTAEFSSPSEPGSTVDSSSLTEPALTAESNSSREPGPTADSHFAMEPGSAVESSSPTEPASTVESSSHPEHCSTAESSSPTESASTLEPSSPSQPGPTAESGSPSEPGAEAGCDVTDIAGGSERVHEALLRAQRKSPSSEEQEEVLWVQARDLRRGGGFFPLRRSRSLPSSLLSPARVVSSVRIQVRPGKAKRCTPTSVSYRYTPEEEEEEEEEARVIEEEPEEEEPSCSSTLFITSRQQDIPREKEEAPRRVPPYPLPPHLSDSTCSLHSTPPGWVEPPPSEMSRPWSSCSMPNLRLQGAPHSAPYTVPHSAPHSAPYSAPYSASLSSPHCAQHRSGSLYGNPYSAPYSLGYGSTRSAPYSADAPHSFQYRDPYSDPYSRPAYPPCPYPPAPLPPPVRPPSTTEMQLKRVLHDIRGTVQSLTQCSSLQGDLCAPMLTPRRSALPLYENTFQELQMMRKSLNVFRTQMMDLELALMRQQDRVYQDLTLEERQDAEQLQQLRSQVRQELQELELQLEDRLLFLDEQLRSSSQASLYRHLMGIRRGHSMDSLYGGSPVNIVEPVSELLREQLSLQAELGYEARGNSAPCLGSASSSGTTSPVRPSRNAGLALERTSQQRVGVYRTSVCLTPTPPPRAPAERPDPPPTGGPAGGNRTLQEGAGGGGRGRGGAESPGLQEEARGGAQSLHPQEERERQPADNLYLQQLIKEIKESIAEEIRQEIVNELLVAASPRKSPTVTRGTTS
ncbi:protein ITPRID2-like [Megalops cyprinoides]|uniref:protein ITPRID2-like n=1 Tax=Megalops cyprinoides TaxID=118141 RepID=UPI001863F0F4|nr:protein ITPRID2-like [Megalops cyprinoides]